MPNRITIISYLDNAIYFFFCLICFFLPISNALVSINFGFIFILFIIKFIFAAHDNSFFRKLFLDRLSLLVIVFTIAIGLSIFNSGEYIKNSFNAWGLKWLGKILLFYFSYFIFRKKNPKILLKFLILSTFLVSINGIFQQINGTGFIRGYSLIKVPCYNFSAMCSTFNHYNGLASFLVIMFFINFGICLEKINNSKKTGISFSDILYYLNIILITYCISMTYSRGGWISLLIGFLIMIAIISCMNKNSRPLILSSVFLILFIVALFFASPLRERLLFIFKGGDASRLGTWKTALTMFKESPLLGKGIGTYMNYLPRYTDVRSYQYAHNSYLQLLVETGILGLIAFLLILIQWLKNSLNFIMHNKENYIFLGIFCGLCAFLIHSFFDNQLFSLKLATLFWLLLGLSSSFIYKIYKE